MLCTYVYVWNMDAQVLANIVDHISALIKRLDPNIGSDNGRAQSAASIVREPKITCFLSTLRSLGEAMATLACWWNFGCQTKMKSRLGPNCKLYAIFGQFRRCYARPSNDHETKNWFFIFFTFWRANPLLISGIWDWEIEPETFCLLPF